LRPTSDVTGATWTHHVAGAPDATALYRNVDDGTATSAADNGTSIVRGLSGAPSAAHTVGYSGAPLGRVTAVTVRYRARRNASAGTAQMKLYAGASLLGTGRLVTLGDGWTDYSDTFAGLSVASANDLRTRIELRNTLATGSHRYTIVWIEVTLDGATDAGTPTTDGGTTAPDTGTPIGGGPFVPYYLDSFFRKPLPPDAPIDAASDAGIAFVKSHPEQTVAYPVINGLAGNRWGTVYFQGACTDPVWLLTGVVPTDVAFLRTEGFHAPARLGDVLTGTSDSPFVVMDRCGDRTMPAGLSVWAANAAHGSGFVIDVSAAGAFQHDSNGLDRRNPRSSSTRNFRSRGAIPDAMVIRRDRVEWAIANNTGLGHVLHMFWVETRTTDGFVHPMVGAEGNKLGWGPEGIRIRIRPTVDLTRRGLSPAGLAVARTLQTHGAYLGDNSGSGTALKAEQDYGQWAGLLTQDALRGLTWDDFVFVQRGYEPP